MVKVTDPSRQLGFVHNAITLTGAGCQVAMQLSVIQDARQVASAQTGSWVDVPQGASVPHPGGAWSHGRKLGDPDSFGEFGMERFAESETAKRRTHV